VRNRSKTFWTYIGFCLLYFRRYFLCIFNVLPLTHRCMWIDNVILLFAAFYLPCICVCVNFVNRRHMTKGGEVLSPGANVLDSSIACVYHMILNVGFYYKLWLHGSCIHMHVALESYRWYPGWNKITSPSSSVIQNSIKCDKIEQMHSTFKEKMLAYTLLRFGGLPHQ